MSKNYYYYCTKIKKMMKLAKAENRVVSFTSEGETIIVKYCKEFNDFGIQFFWLLNNKEAKLNDEVLDFLGKYDPILNYEEMVTANMDITQFGLVTMNTSCEEDIADVMDHFKTHTLQHVKDTSYILCGKKLLRVIQYYGFIRNPVEYLDTISNWNDDKLQNSVAEKVMKPITTGISYCHSKEDNSIIFSIGENRTVFKEQVNEVIPQFICVDTFLGIIVNELTNQLK